jgi:hypothetical protein
MARRSNCRNHARRRFTRSEHLGTGTLSQAATRSVKHAFSAGLTAAVLFAAAVAHDSVGAQARGATARTNPAALDFAVGNVEFLLVHEIAHFLIDEKNVPIMGPEENAADYIATLALLREAPLDPTQEHRALRFLVAAADAFALAWETGVTAGAEAPYWRQHGLSIQRYYQVACLLYGSDPATFARVPQIAGLPDERARSCAGEYAQADAGIQWLLETFGRRAGDPPSAATQIVYDEAPSLVSARVLEELRRIELLERIAERMQERFTIEQPLTMAMRRCGRAEAAWVPHSRELVICYELLDALYLLGLRRGDSSLRPVAPVE